MDTGAAATLIQRQLVPEAMIDPDGAEGLMLIGVTGHKLRVYGTAEVSVGTTDADGQDDALAEHSMVVCDENVLNEVQVLIGRDFLSAQRAVINYEKNPIMLIWGQQIPLYTVEECQENLGIWGGS